MSETLALTTDRCVRRKSNPVLQSYRYRLAARGVVRLSVRVLTAVETSDKRQIAEPLPGRRGTPTGIFYRPGVPGCP